MDRDRVALLPSMVAKWKNLIEWEFIASSSRHAHATAAAVYSVSLNVTYPLLVDAAPTRTTTTTTQHRIIIAAG